MRVPVNMPILNQGMQSGTIVSWLVAAGQSVQRGDAIAEIEADKAVLKMGASVSGTLVEIIRFEGDEVAVGTPIAFIETMN